MECSQANIFYGASSSNTRTHVDRYVVIKNILDYIFNIL
jgi:hypothetical protein